MLPYTGNKESQPQKLANNLIIIIKNNWDFFFLKTYAM